MSLYFKYVEIPIPQGYILNEKIFAKFLFYIIRFLITFSNSGINFR